MTAGDMWSPILSRFGTTWSSNASSGGPHSVIVEVSNRGRTWGETGKSSAQLPGVENKTFVPFLLFFLTLGKKTNQQSLSWFGFACGCDRAVRDFMGRCPMIHWVIGFRPVLIAAGPGPKNLEGFRRACFSTIQQNGIWSASASRHSRRPSQFRGP